MSELNFRFESLSSGSVKRCFHWLPNQSKSQTIKRRQKVKRNTNIYREDNKNRFFSFLIPKRKLHMMRGQVVVYKTLDSILSVKISELSLPIYINYILINDMFSVKIFFKIHILKD